MMSAQTHPAPSRPLRVILAAIGIFAWYWSQGLIGHRVAPPGAVTDQIHLLTAPWHAILLSHATLTNALLITSSFFIDLLGIFLILWGTIGPSVRPFSALLVLFLLRQMCQAITALPTPDGMIWHHPGIPSLFVTYGVSSDLYFSGHTGIAVLGAVELARLHRPWLTRLGMLIAVFEIATVFVLRAHYFMDVFTGVVTALLIAHLSLRWSPVLDRWLVWAQSWRNPRG